MIPWESCVLWLGYPIQNGVWPDVSKHDNDGAIIGAVWVGDSFEFDGIDDYVNCGNDSMLGISDNITVEAWVKDSDVTDEGMLVSKGWFLWIDNDNSKPRLNTGSGYKVSSTGPAIGLDEWVHVGFVINSGHLYYIQNGVLYSCDTGVTLTPSGNLYIGVDAAINNHFNGHIKQVRIYNKALSAEQVQESYRQGYKLI